MPLKTATSARRPFLFEVMDRVCIGQNIAQFSTTKKFRCFQPQTTVAYDSFCDDFGPMNLASIARFVKLLDNELQTYPTCKIVYCAGVGRRELTNAVFLLGAYLILKLDATADSAMDAFPWLQAPMIESFRDATFSEPTFTLSLLDCWRGLERGKLHGWIRYETANGLWGQLDLDEYSYLADPHNADLHIIVPGKLVALRGPRDLGPCRTYADDPAGGRRCFSPAHYAALFREMGVTDVVRLCAPEYDHRAFTSLGFAHHHLPVLPGAAPPNNVVRRFLAVADAAPGAVAVHCVSGLGRTGTLAALYLVHACGFGPRDALAWLRLVRPGSVHGPQQHYLCAATTITAAPRAAAVAGGRDGPPESVLASQVGRRRAVLRRERPAAARPSAGAGGPCAASPAPLLRPAPHDLCSVSHDKRGVGGGLRLAALPE